MASVAIGHAGTSTISKRVPCRRKPMGSGASGSSRGAAKCGVILER